MRASLHLISVLLASIAMPAIAADDIPTMDISRFLVGQAPSGFGAERPAATAPVEKQAAAQIEKPAALNGTLYAVVAPTYTGSTTSFIRLFNGATNSSTFSITVVGSPSGRTMGTATIQVPSNAAPQYPLSDIVAAASAGGLTNGDTSYALYIQNADSTAGYQHVTFNRGNLFFENNSICKQLLSPTVVAINNAQVLTNVHTSRLSAFPSTITLSNYWNGPVTYRLTVRDAVTGGMIGQVNVQAAANATYAIPESQLESQIPFTPTSSQSHVNVFIVDASGSAPNAVSGVSITNNTLAAEINMSTACAINALPSSGTGGDGGFSGY